MIIEAQLTFFFFLKNSVVYHLTIDKILYLLEFSVELNISKILGDTYGPLLLNIFPEQPFFDLS